MGFLRRVVLGSAFLVVASAAPAPACTTFRMDTPDGPIVGANIDLFIPGDGLVFVNRRGVAKSGFGPSTTGETIEWVSQYGSVTFSLAGREFAVSGMNEAGLAVSSMELLASEFPEPDARPPLPIGPWEQFMLDNCATVEEVIAMERVVRIQDDAPPLHFLFTDANGNSAAIEWFDGQCEARTGADLPTAAMSNMPYGRAQEALERGGARWWWSNPGQSAERFAACDARAKAFDPSGEISAVDYAFGTLTGPVAASHTKWSIVYDIANREAWYGTVVNQKVKHVVFADLSFECDEPLLMLDINAPIEGDVADAFVPYDPDVNGMVFRRFCAQYGLDVPEEVSVAVTSHVDGFKCAEETAADPRLVPGPSRPQLQALTEGATISRLSEAAVDE